MPTSSGFTSAALLRPTPRMPPSPPPPAARRYMKYQTPPTSASGRPYDSRNAPTGLGGGSTVYFTPAASNCSISFGSPLGTSTLVKGTVGGSAGLLLGF